MCPTKSQPPKPDFPLRAKRGGTHRSGNHDQLNNQCSTNERTRQGTFAPEPGMDQTQPSQLRVQAGRVLLRKEVIQPHLPVRLPCYDFVPIASPTFDRSPHKWLGHGLRVLPTFVT